MRKKTRSDFSKSSDAVKAYASVIRCLSRRDHTPLELIKKLTRYYESETVNLAIQKAKERKYLKDEKSLKNIFDLILSKKNKSHRYINSVLAKKGLSPVSYDSYSELKKCQNLLLSKFGENTSLTAAERVKVYRYLTNRGFDLETIKKAIQLRKEIGAEKNEN